MLFASNFVEIKHKRDRNGVVTFIGIPVQWNAKGNKQYFPWSL
jgi:hypothetical protein